MKRARLIRLVLVMTLVVVLPAVASAQGTLFVEGDKVGIGIANPVDPLHIYKSDGTAKFTVEEDNATAAFRTLMLLENNGGIRFTMRTGPQAWLFSAAAHFVINYTGTPGNTMRLLQNGNLEILGTLSEGSSREVKQGFRAVDAEEMLAKVAQLPLSTWQYTTDDQQARHLGPMAEDFHAMFGLGSDSRQLAPRDVAGVALAAIKGLQAVVQEKDHEIQELRAKVERIEELLETRIQKN